MSYLHDALTRKFLFLQLPLSETHKNPYKVYWSFNWVHKPDPKILFIFGIETEDSWLLFKTKKSEGILINNNGMQKNLIANTKRIHEKYFFEENTPCYPYSVSKNQIHNTYGSTHPFIYLSWGLSHRL